jgi:hypothetical protein
MSVLEGTGGDTAKPNGHKKDEDTWEEGQFEVDAHIGLGGSRRHAPLSDAVRYPAGARPSKCIILYGLGGKGRPASLR